MSKINIFGLGGLNENGKNMYVIEVDDSIFVFEAGLQYADEHTLGIDYMIPNIDYLKEKYPALLCARYKIEISADDTTADIYEKIGRKRIVRYAKFNKHQIEISPWVLELDEEIIKNTKVIHIVQKKKEYKRQKRFTAMVKRFNVCS